MGRHKAYDRAAVLDKAMQLFWKKGYEGAHLQELVDVTGLNRFSLYKEFRGKEGLFQEALDKYLKGLQDLSQALNQEPLGLDNIVRYINDLIHSDFSYGCFMVNTLTQRYVVQEEIIKRLEAFVERAEQAFIKNLQAAQQNGELPADTDITGLAKFLVVFDIGMVTHEVIEPKMADKERVFEILKAFLGKGSDWNVQG